MSNYEMKQILVYVVLITGMLFIATFMSHCNNDIKERQCIEQGGTYNKAYDATRSFCTLNKQ
jgi:hypothetical protein